MFELRVFTQHSSKSRDLSGLYFSENLCEGLVEEALVYIEGSFTINKK